MYDRAYRIRVAQQCSLTHSLLPKNQWVTAETVSINDNNNSGWDGIVTWLLYRTRDTFDLTLMKLLPSLLNVVISTTSRSLPVIKSHRSPFQVVYTFNIYNKELLYQHHRHLYIFQQCCLMICDVFVCYMVYEKRHKSVQRDRERYKEYKITQGMRRI